MKHFLVILLLLPGLALANDREVRLSAPEALVESGVLKFALPRFSLKNQVRVLLVAPEEAQVELGPEGRPLFTGLGETWALKVRAEDHPGTAKFVSWITSEVGRNTIFGFQGGAVFGPAEAVEVALPEVEIDGDADLGRTLAWSKCGRCHVTERGRGMAGIGSTPSFFVLRSFEDWEVRFASFFVLAPHGAFTQIAEITEPFPEDRPSPIAPVEMTIEELEAMLAYVAAMEAADLGAPLQHQ